MNTFKLAWHQTKKDLRQHAVILLLWVLLLIVFAWAEVSPSSLNLDSGKIFFPTRYTLFIATTITALLVVGDSPVGRRGPIHTRPVGWKAILVAKMFCAGFVLLPLVLSSIVPLIIAGERDSLIKASYLIGMHYGLPIFLAISAGAIVSRASFAVAVVLVGLSAYMLVSSGVGEGTLVLLVLGNFVALVAFYSTKNRFALAIWALALIPVAQSAKNQRKSHRDASVGRWREASEERSRKAMLGLFERGKEKRSYSDLLTYLSSQDKQIVAELPLDSGQVWRAGADRVTIDRVFLKGTQIELSLSEQTVWVSKNRDDYGSKRGEPWEYYIYQPETGETVVATKSGGGGHYPIPFPLPQVVRESEHRRVSLPDRLDRRSPGDEMKNWVGTANLLIVYRPPSKR